LTTLGARTLTADYAGDANFTGSSSPGEAHTVNQASTTTTITSDLPDPSVVGQTVTVNYTVTVDAPGSGTPSGNVTVSDGVDSCVGTVGAGTCDITLTNSGARTLTATYAGDPDFSGSASGGTGHVVNAAATTTTVTSDLPDPSSSGQNVTVQYSVVVNAPGSGVPTGNVTVSDGVDECIATVAAGQCDVALSTVGARTLTATFSGSADFATSAGTAAHTVNLAATTTDVASSVNPSVFGQPVTFTATVTSSFGDPTGTVQFQVDAVNLGTAVPVDGSGQATSPATSTMAVGNRLVTADYSGDARFGASGGSLTGGQIVNQANAATSITSDDPDPSVTGETVTVVYTVTAVAPGAGTPTGNVTVGDGTDSCTGLVSEGSCQLVLTTVGARTLTASYAGDTNFNLSSSGGEPHQVNSLPTVSFTTATQAGAEDVGSLTVTAALSEAIGLDVTIPYSVGGTATEGLGEDFTISASPLVIPAGNPSGDITIAVNNDAFDEADETVVVTMGNPVNAQLGTTTEHTATITDNDPTPSLSIGDVTVTEGDAGTVNAVFDVTLSVASGQTVTVDWATGIGRRRMVRQWRRGITRRVVVR
jgi:hypothetical protein